MALGGAARFRVPVVDAPAVAGVAVVLRNLKVLDFPSLKADSGQLFDRIDRLGLADVQRIEDALQCRTLMLRPLDGARAGDRFDPAHAGRDAAFGDDGEEADVAGGRDVCAAAKLQAEVRDAHDADLVAVFLSEQRHRAGGDRLLRGADLRLHGSVSADLFVDDSLDPIDLVPRERLEVGEIESQPVGRHERAGLLRVRAQHLP